MAVTGLSVLAASPAAAAATVSGFAQCANGSTGVTCTGWVNGSLGTSNSHFAEDQVVPQRALISLPADNLEHSLTFTYQDRKGSIHSYDSLATWNKTVSGADPCQGLAAALCAASPSHLNMTSDPAANVPPATGGSSPAVSAHELAQADRQWTMYGGALTTDVAATHSSPASGDDLVTVTVKFRNATPGTATTGVLLFGGHLAVGGPSTAPRAWGANLGATSVSGGPYAFKLEAVDGSSTGATSNTIQASGVAPLPPAAFTVTKSASSATAAAGGLITYTVTVKNTGGQAGTTTFVDDYTDSITNVSTPAGCTKAGGTLSCTTGSLAPGGQQVFSYTANMPATFSGGAGTGGCTASTYPVPNTAKLANGTTASALVCVSAAAQFAITKTASPANPAPGQTVTYTVTVTNNGNAAGSTGFVDDYDNRLTPTVPIGCTNAAGAFTCTTGSLAANGGSQVFSYTAAMPLAFDGGTACPGGYQVSNTATLTGGASASRDVCVGAAPAFSVLKTVSDTTATPGQVLTYTLTVTNNGQASGSTSVTDTPAAGTTLGALPNGCTSNANGSFTCATGTILAGGNKVFTYTATMPSSFDGPSGTGGCPDKSYPIANSASVVGGNTSTKTVCVGAAANFTIAKSATPAAALPGQTVSYTVTVTNTGAASGSTGFVDDYADVLIPTLPTSANGTCTQGTGSFSCSTGKVLAGGSATFTYSAVMPSSFGPVSGGQTCSTGTYPIGNTATLTSGPAASRTVCVTAAPAYTVTKVVDKPNALPGDVVTYTVTVKNTGDAAGSTSFTDDFDDRLLPSTVVAAPSPGGCSLVGTTNLTLSCSTGVISAHGQQTFTYSATLPATYAGTTGTGTCATGKYRVANTATLANSGAASAQVCVTAAPSFLVDKSVDNESPAPGDVLTYTITVTNTGNAAGSTSFTDDYDNRLTPSVPAGCSAAGGVLSCSTGTIAAQKTQVFTYTATLPTTYSGASGTGTCGPNTYEVANHVELSNGRSDDATACVNASSAFTITKKADSTAVGVGATVTYTVVVKNTGAAEGTATFTDDYDNRLHPTTPSGCTDNGGSFTCTTGPLPSNGSATFTYTAVMPSSFASTAAVGTCAAGSYAVANTAKLDGGASAKVQVCVAAAPAFSIAKKVDHKHVAAGDVVTYTVTVGNTGTAGGSTSFTDQPDGRLSPSAATSDPAGNTCVPTTLLGVTSFSCTTGTIEPGGTQTFTYTAATPSTFSGQPGGTGCTTGEYGLDNTATAGAAHATVTVCAAAAPAFTIAKTAEEPVVVPGGAVHYTVTVTNTGNAAGGTSFTDDYDPSLTVAAPPDGCIASVAGSSFSCDTGVIAAGASTSFRYTGTVPATFDGSPDATACDPPAYPITNTATLSGGGHATRTVCVGASPAFTVVKKSTTANPVPGGAVGYTVTVTNTGTAAGATDITDTPDAKYDLTGVTVDGCTLHTGTFTCSTGTLLVGKNKVFTFTLTAPATFSGPSGQGSCAPGTYLLTNTASTDGGEPAAADVCVPASPNLTVAKKADDTTPDPGQKVLYTVTVANTGTVAGGTTVTDDYDNRLTPTVPDGCSAAGGVLTCSTGTIQPGGSKTFEYDATMPATYTGPSGGNGCPTATYPVVNAVQLGSGATASVTACVAAAPVVKLAKTASLDTASNGDQTITYTLTYTNSGAAEALATVVTDPVPSGTAFVSCTPTCTTPSGTATWNVGSVAPAGGTGSLVLKVKVTSNQVCVITNTAQIKVGPAAAIGSNTVTTNVSPVPDTANAKSSGSAVGLSIRTSGLLDLIGPIVGGLFTNNNTLTLSRAASAQNGPGGPATNSDQLLGVKIPGSAALVKAGVLTATSASSVTAAPAEARQTTTSEVAGVCLVPVGGLCTVESGTVRAVASTMATGTFATVSSAGSTIENLRVAGILIPVDLSQTTTIPLNKAVFGPNSYVAINERTSSAGLSGQKYTADQSVAMIHVKITGLLLGVQAVEIYVAQATAHSEFPKTFLCTAGKNQSVSGHAYTARLYTGPLLADLLQGYSQISPLGGSESEHVVGAVIPSTGVAVNAQVADSSSTGALNATSSTARSYAEVAGDGTKPLCVLSYVTNCVVKATAIRSEARSTATSAGSTTTDTGTSFLGLSVLGIPISGTPAPNTTIPLPGIGFIVLNEQSCDNGAAANHSCTALGHTGMTVRAVRVVITVANNILGLSPGIELVVSEAHADSTFG